jgi:hypothetical protein
MRTLPFGQTFGETFNAPGASFQTTLSLHAGSTRTPPHSHANDYICFVLAGGFCERSTRGSFVWKAGDAISYHAEEWHEDSFDAHGARCINVHLPKGFQLQIELCGGRCNASARSAAEALAAEAALHFAGDHLSSDALAAELIGAVSCKCAEETDSSWVSRLIELLDDEPGRRLDALCARVSGRAASDARCPCFSPQYWADDRRLSPSPTTHRALPPIEAHSCRSGRYRDGSWLCRSVAHESRVPRFRGNVARRVPSRGALIRFKTAALNAT